MPARSISSGAAQQRGCYNVGNRSSAEAPMVDLAAQLDAAFQALRAAVLWRDATQRADDALAHAADVHQGIEAGDVKAEHRKVQVLETEARLARDAFDLELAQVLAVSRRP